MPSTEVEVGPVPLYAHDPSGPFGRGVLGGTPLTLDERRAAMASEKARMMERLAGSGVRLPRRWQGAAGAVERRDRELRRELHLGWAAAHPAEAAALQAAADNAAATKVQALQRGRRLRW
jgi:hypothetical protein